MRERDNDQRPGKPQMQRSGDVSLRARIRKRGRNLKPAKDANRFTIGGGNQVAANDYRKEQEIQEEMPRGAPARVKRE